MSLVHIGIKYPELSMFNSHWLVRNCCRENLSLILSEIVDNFCFSQESVFKIISTLCVGRRRANRSASNSLADNPFSGEQRALRLRLRHHKVRKSLRRAQKCDVRSTFHRTIRIGLSAEALGFGNILSIVQLFSEIFDLAQRQYKLYAIKIFRISHD